MPLWFFAIPQLLLEYGLPFGAIVLIARSVSRPTGSGQRRWWRGVVTAVLLTPVVPFFFWNFEETGWWECLVCGRKDYRVLFFDVPVLHDVQNTDFSTWFDQSIHEPHSHQWVGLGCHHVGLGGYGCYTMRRTPYFVSLPHIPDQAVAVRMATQVLHAPSDERRAMVNDLLWGESPNPADKAPCDSQNSLPWQRYDFVRHGEEVQTREEFDHEYGSWLRCHPRWKNGNAE